jgi:hypothetical protein
MVKQLYGPIIYHDIETIVKAISTVKDEEGNIIGP